MVEERINGKLTLNQPAGHLDHGESLIEAVIRETQEETAWSIEPIALVGIYQWLCPDNNQTYLRYCFVANALQHDGEQALDADIERAVWLSKAEITQRQAQARSPLVLQCLHDYDAQHRFPLSILKNSYV